MNVDVHHLAAAYAMDALGDDERDVFEAHYPFCDTCASDVADFRETLDVLGELTRSRPRPALRSEVLEAVARTSQCRPDRRGRSRWRTR